MAGKNINIVSGGTVFHVRPHLALCAPAYGTTGRKLEKLCREKSSLAVHLYLTKMAGGKDDIETNDDIDNLLWSWSEEPATKIIFMNAALCDFTGEIDGGVNGKYGDRLKSRDGEFTMRLTPAAKMIQKIRMARKDVFLVGFKTTCGATSDEQYLAGLNLLKEASCNLVLANDVKTRLNMVITPEEARYHETIDRDAALAGLVDMAVMRSHLTFTRSTVVAGDPVPWDSPEVPETLRKVVDHCITRGAYKPFRGATVGHFACKKNDTTFLTSIRKSNFNDLHKNGLVKVVTDGPDSVIAYGSKPSVGGQSQRIVFNEHDEYDCIVHFHCPKKLGSQVPVRSQREYECGSHECGRNTSRGLAKFGNLSAVYLDEHGPNIVFHHSIDPKEVIDFIEANFDLDAKTGGYVELGGILK